MWACLRRLLASVVLPSASPLSFPCWCPRGTRACSVASSSFGGSTLAHQRWCFHRIRMLTSHESWRVRHTLPGCRNCALASTLREVHRFTLLTLSSRPCTHRRSGACAPVVPALLSCLHTTALGMCRAERGELVALRRSSRCEPVPKKLSRRLQFLMRRAAQRASLPRCQRSRQICADQSHGPDPVRLFQQRIDEFGVVISNSRRGPTESLSDV